MAKNAISPNTSVTYWAGCAKAKDWIVLAGQINARPEGSPEYTRVDIYKAGKWGYYDLPGVFVHGMHSYLAPTQGTVFLGRGGEVVFSIGDDRRIETIADAGTGPDRYGYVNMLRMIGSKLH